MNAVVPPGLEATLGVLRTARAVTHIATQSVSGAHLMYRFTNGHQMDICILDMNQCHIATHTDTLH